MDVGFEIIDAPTLWLSMTVKVALTHHISGSIRTILFKYETAFTVCERNNQIVRGNAGAGGPYAVSGHRMPGGLSSNRALA